MFDQFINSLTVLRRSSEPCRNPGYGRSGQTEMAQGADILPGPVPWLLPRIRRDPRDLL